MIGPTRFAVLVLAFGAAPLAAQHVCPVLTSAQVAPLLGNGATPKESGSGMVCTWTAPNGLRSLQVTVAPATEQTRSHFDMMYAKPGKTAMGELRQETGLGERAVSLTTASGINFQVVQGPHLLTFAYANKTGAPTANDHHTLRAIAARVVGAF